AARTRWHHHGGGRGGAGTLPGGPPRPLPARTLRWVGAARGDRAGRGGRAATAARGRADHRPRPTVGRGNHARAAGADRPWPHGPAGDPRSRRGALGRRPHRGHVRRKNRGGLPHGLVLRPTGPPVLAGITGRVAGTWLHSHPGREPRADTATHRVCVPPPVSPRQLCLRRGTAVGELVRGEIRGLLAPEHGHARSPPGGRTCCEL